MKQIKMVVVDMDGTFLNSDNDYNRTRFEALYKQMQARDIKFVVASGNQYYQLKSFFKGKDNEISYISENGALIIKENKEIFCAQMDFKIVDSIVEFLNHYKEVHYIVSGRKTAYIKKSAPDKFKKIAAIYNHELKEVERYANFDDQIFKFALITPEENTLGLIKDFQEHFTHQVSAVSSGHGSIDIIIPGIHKGNALSILQKEWNIHEDEIMVFGDGGNDIEMLKHGKYSYAMANAPDKVKSVSRSLAPSNNDEGVLEVLETYLNKGIIL